MVEGAAVAEAKLDYRSVEIGNSLCRIGKAIALSGGAAYEAVEAAHASAAPA